MRFDMTRGKPVSLLARFALPLIVSSILQQLYTLCDSAIVGRLLGETAFAAVGAAAFLHGIPLSILLGCTQGFGVAVGQRFGAKDDGGVNRFFSTALLLSLSFGLALSILGLVLLKPLLGLMKTPEQLLPDSAGYLTVLWLGLAVTAVMNMAASGLRAMGDSRTPLFGLLLSSFLNILLDVLLVAVLPLGVMGTALATVLSQLAAAGLFLRALSRAGGGFPPAFAPARQGADPGASAVGRSAHAELWGERRQRRAVPAGDQRLRCGGDHRHERFLPVF